MKVMAFGDIMAGGTSAFTGVANIDGPRLLVSFSGAIRVDNPYVHLQPFINQLVDALPKQPIEQTTLDFTKLRFCNSNGFYVIMDIIELVFQHSVGSVIVRRLSEDDWHQETLPILVDYEQPAVLARTRFEDQREL